MRENRVISVIFIHMDGKGRKCRAPGWSRVEGGLPVFMVIQRDMRSWQMAEERWPWGP